MKKIIIDETNQKIRITSNMRSYPLKSFFDFTEKEQKNILNTYDYMSIDEIENNFYIDESTCISDILLLNSPWTQTSSILEKTLYNIVNKNNNFFSVGYIDHSYYRDYIAIDNSCDCYIKLNVKYL
jgi:hypothetical protein